MRAVQEADQERGMAGGDAAHGTRQDDVVPPGVRVWGRFLLDLGVFLISVLRAYLGVSECILGVFRAIQDTLYSIRIMGVF